MMSLFANFSKKLSTESVAANIFALGKKARSAAKKKQKDALKIQPPEPHPNPLTQAAGAQESESPLIPR